MVASETTNKNEVRGRGRRSINNEPRVKFPRFVVCGLVCGLVYVLLLCLCLCFVFCVLCSVFCVLCVLTWEFSERVRECVRVRVREKVNPLHSIIINILHQLSHCHHHGHIKQAGLFHHPAGIQRPGYRHTLTTRPTFDTCTAPPHNARIRQSPLQCDHHLETFFLD